MNILYYCDEYPPFKTGGIGSVTKIVGEELAKRGHNIYVIGYYPYNCDLPQYSEIDGVHVYRLNIGIRKMLGVNLFPILHKLRLSKRIIQKELNYTEDYIQRFIVKKNIDILEMTDFYAFNYANGNLDFKKFNIPTILRVHGSVSYVNFILGKKRKNNKRNDVSHFLRCDYLSAVSKYSLNYVKDNYKTKHFIKENVIYNPIEEDFIKHNQINADSKIILFIGRLTETKGCYTLIKAFNKIAAKYRDWKLVMIGGGDIELAKSYIHSENREQVVFEGFCNREELKVQIDNCSFACLPSYSETLGMAALEVMARGKALIFTNRTAGAEVVNDGYDGLLVNPENVDEIVSQITLLIENVNLRNELAENAYYKVKNNFAARCICDKIETFYKSLICKKKIL